MCFFEGHCVIVLALTCLLAGTDMKTFDILRARIPTSMFKDIVYDIQIALNEYGDHRNVESRSRCLAPVSISITLQIPRF